MSLIQCLQIPHTGLSNFVWVKSLKQRTICIYVSEMLSKERKKNGKTKLANLPRSFVVGEEAAAEEEDEGDDGGSSVISCKLYSLRTSWIAANSFNPKF